MCFLPENSAAFHIGERVEEVQAEPVAVFQRPSEAAGRKGGLAFWLRSLGFWFTCRAVL